MTARSKVAVRWLDFVFAHTASPRLRVLRISSLARDAADSKWEVVTQMKNRAKEVFREGDAGNQVGRWAG